MGSRFFQDDQGNNSSSRLLGFIVVVVCLAFVEQVLFKSTDVVSGATAGGLLFVTIAGPVMAFLYKQKQTESESNK